MGNSLLWTRADTRPVLAGNELHVWRASLELSPSLFRRVENTLNADEKERAERFLVPQATEHFVSARGILRDLLGMYLGIAPAKVKLSYGAQGKPSLSPAHNSEISFSVSHSHGVGLFAFDSGSEIGVDVEQVKPNFRGMEIASHFFSEEEIAGLAQLPPALKNEGFFGCWTRKEAYVKAHGQGLSIPLRSFTVSFADKEQLLRDEKGAVWSCYALEPALGFSAAVVAAGENWKLRYYDWSAVMESAAPALQTSDECTGAG
jgi:4'-phosphopantetheinyl transferase